MATVTRQQSCPNVYTRQSSSQLPMGNDEFMPADFTSLSGYSSPPTQKGLRRFHRVSFFPVPRWMLGYTVAVISFFIAHRSGRAAAELSIALGSEIQTLEVQNRDTAAFVHEAKESRDEVRRRHKKLRKTQSLLQHELKMKEEIFELTSSKDYEQTMKKFAKRQKGTVMTWIEQRQEALLHKIQNLQGYIQKQSRKQVLEKYGPGPHRVEFQIQANTGKTKGTFIVELAPLDMMPHSIETFLDMVANRMWDDTIFHHHSNLHNHVIAAAPVDFGSLETKHFHFQALGYTGVSFPEYSPEYTHKEFTLGFSGRGPNFYINVLDNSVHHGPGGQGHHDLPNDADPCFGKIVSGKNFVLGMMPIESPVKDPVSWQDYDLSHIIQVRIIK